MLRTSMRSFLRSESISSSSCGLRTARNVVCHSADTRRDDAQIPNLGRSELA
jgi:hypothetical protein